MKQTELLRQLALVQLHIREAAGWAEADSTGGAHFQYRLLQHFGMNGQILLLIQPSVYWYINPEYIASVDPDSKIGNCGAGEPVKCAQTHIILREKYLVQDKYVQKFQAK